MYAYAANSTTVAPTFFESISGMMPLIIMFAVFYFFVIRSSNKKEADRKEMINNITKGKKVMVMGGLIGVVNRVFGDDDNKKIELTVAKDVNVVLLIDSINEVISENKSDNKGRSKPDNKSDDKKKKKVDKKKKEPIADKSSSDKVSEKKAKEGAQESSKENEA